MQTFDAQAALGFVTSQTTYVETTVNQTVYEDIKYPSLIPVDTSANPFAQTVTYYSSDKFGKADWINGNSDDIPLAGTERAKFQTAVYTAGIGYGYGWEEIRQAQMLGMNLTADDALEARRAYEEMVDGVALRGDPTKGFNGLINSPAITAAAATTGDWETATAIQQIADVNNALLSQASGTNWTSLANTLLLPYSKLAVLANTPLPNTTMPALTYLRQNNVYTLTTGLPLTITGVVGLETAGAGGVARMVAYRKSPDVLKLHIPMPHQFLPVFQDGPLHWVVPGVFRLGGLDIRRPAEVRYVDGV